MNQVAAAAIVLLGAVAWAYQDTARWILDGWRQNPYYSHGPLVPVLSGWLLWRYRLAIVGVPWRAWWPGLAVVAVAAAAYLAGRLLDINLLLGLSLLLLIHGLVLAAAGPAVYRRTWFALAFLVFAVPVSQLVIHHYGFPLQLASARLATGLMSLLTGADARAVGTLMRLDGQDYLVAAECSGFKALLGLTMVGVLAAYLTDTTARRKAVIALLAPPIAVVANVVRLLAILVIGRLVGHDFAVTTFHDLSGLVMLAVAVAALLGVARLVVGPEADLSTPAPVDSPRLPHWPALSAPLALAAVLVLLAGGVGRALVPPPPPRPNVDLAQVPLTLGRWQGTELPISPRVRQELGDVAIIQREYRRTRDELPLQVIVICGRGRRSLHPPAACYVGAGHELMEERETLLHHAGEDLHFERLIVGRRSRPALIALYTFTDGITTTPDYARHQSSSFARGQVIWTQLHFAAPWRGSVEATEKDLLPFVQEAWPAIRQALPRAERR